MRQTVEEAARKHQAYFEPCCSFYDESINFSREVRESVEIGRYSQSYESFIKGAEWQKNSVWHRTDEKPENDRMVLGIYNDRFPVICGPDNSGWDDTARFFDITAWAYVDDLLPDSFDEILEANKDVLKRIKEKGD